MTAEDQQLVLSMIQDALGGLPKVRIPELPDYGLNGAKLTLDDRVPVWRASDNKTVQTKLEVLKALFVNSSEEVVTPTPTGDSIWVTAGPSEAGTNTFNIPAIAGEDFLLSKAGYGPLEPGVDYEILSSGGFKLLPEGNLINLDEKYTLRFVDYQSGGSGGGTGSTNTTSLFNGSVTIASTITLNSSTHLNKLIKLRPSGQGVVTSLAKIEDVPENSLWCFESSLAQYESTVSTSNGQYIYFNGQSVTAINLRKGEYLLLYRDADGYYAFGYAPGMVQVAKQVLFGYSIDDNEIKLDGQTLSKALYPRFWAEVQKMGASLVSEATWQTVSVSLNGVTIPRPYRGCFADVDANTFRVPDFTDMGLRVLGVDATQRYYNNAGGFQLDDLKEHDHGMNFNTAPQSGSTTQCFVQVGGPEKGRTGKTGGKETRMQNIGLIAKMKV
jgi:hypothetical protein